MPRSVKVLMGPSGGSFRFYCRGKTGVRGKSRTELCRRIAPRHETRFVEVGGALFKFGKVFDRPKAPLGAMDLLIKHAAEAHGINAKTPFLRTIIRIEMKLRRGVAVDVAIQTRNTQTRLRGLTIVGGIELFLGERSEEKLQSVQLNRRQKIFEQPVEVVYGDHFPA